MGFPSASNLRLFLDPSTLALSDGASVTSWTDSSGQGNTAATYSGSTAPKFKTGVIGNKPGIRFGGASTDGLKGSFAAFTAGAATVMFAIANVLTPTSAYGGYVCCGSGGGNDYSDPKNFASSANGSGASMSFSVNSSSSPIYTQIDKPTIFAFSITASAVVMYVNGFAVTSNAVSSGNQTYATYVIGQRFASGAAATNDGGAFDIGQIGIFDAALSASSIQQNSLWMLQQCGLFTPPQLPIVGKSPGIRRID